jgi:predicted transcriptional regulator
MKITIDIGGKDYIFEMNRMTYKRLLADEEYAKMQNEIANRVKEAKSKSETTSNVFNSDVTALMLSRMVMQEQTFYYSLLINQPEMTNEEAIELLDSAIEEYGNEAVSELCSKLTENFIHTGEEPKKKMVMKIV